MDLNWCLLCQILGCSHGLTLSGSFSQGFGAVPHFHCIPHKGGGLGTEWEGNNPSSCRPRASSTVISGNRREDKFSQWISRAIWSIFALGCFPLGLASREFSILNSRVSRPFSFLDFPGNERPNTREIVN